MNPDLVYPLKVSGDAEELKYSLRSIYTNAQGLYNKIWIVTNDELPPWLTGIEVIRAGAPGEKHIDVRAKVQAVTEHPDIPDQFLLMNDDFYLIEPIEEWAAFHMGSMDQYIKENRRRGRNMSRTWFVAMTNTAKWMQDQGYSNSLVRQGHRPLLWNKRALGDTLKNYPENQTVDIAGLYDIAGAGGVGERGMNSKIGITPKDFHHKLKELNIPWLSTSNDSFNNGMIGGYIRGMFRTPSIYEV